jgi:DivIVA domain-containing protein
MPLTPADVRNKQFSTTRLRPGYDEEEVDAFLDEVEAELDRLIQENEELRAKLAEVLRGGKVPALNAPHAEAPADLMAAEPPRHEPEPVRPPEPVMMPTRPAEDNMDTAARVLALAQQTADQAIADARREADETLGRARREADDILTKARRQSEQITSDARARAESLERDAQERHRQAMGSLVQSREELERRVDDLRAFEREYRSWPSR